MRIDADTRLTQAQGVAPASQRPAQPPAPARPAHDTVEISDRARLIDAAREALHRLPDVRADRVEALRARIASGSYDVPAAEVADRILAALEGR